MSQDNEVDKFCLQDITSISISMSNDSDLIECFIQDITCILMSRGSDYVNVAFKTSHLYQC
jgi:hypothetical protein